MKVLSVVFIIIISHMATKSSTQTLADRIKFATVEKANELLMKQDGFTESWSQFDIDSQMQKPNSTKAELLSYISTQTKAWTSDEKAKMVSIFMTIDQKINEQGYIIDFPEEIYFVKTTTEEEGGAGGYTRANYVVLKDDILSQEESGLINITVHELFHVLTRRNAEFRKSLYSIIGFNIMNPVHYPAKLKQYRITNPDAPQVDSYINLQVDGKSKDCMMILYSNRDYIDGQFFKYLNIGFLSLKGEEVKSVEYKDDMPVVYSMQEVSGFFEQVGKNTQYIIHPEEILADNFVYTILGKKDLINPEIVDKIKAELKK